MVIQGSTWNPLSSVRRNTSKQISNEYGQLKLYEHIPWYHTSLKGLHNFCVLLEQPFHIVLAKMTGLAVLGAGIFARECEYSSPIRRYLN